MTFDTAFDALCSGDFPHLDPTEGDAFSLGMLSMGIETRWLFGGDMPAALADDTEAAPDHVSPTKKTLS